MVEILSSKEVLDLEQVTTTLDQRLKDIRSGDADELIWFVKHPPVFTGGTESENNHLLNVDGVPVHETKRGGAYVWHGPGTLNTYVMFDLKQHKRFLDKIHNWIIETLADFNIKGERLEEQGAGVFVKRKHGYDKIAAMGWEIRDKITYWGFIMHVNPDMKEFNRFTICGLTQTGVTSMQDLGVYVTPEDVQQVLIKNFTNHFK